MPGRNYRRNVKTDGELKMRVLAVLDAADEGIMPTLDWIKQQDMILSPYSTQKLSRVLGALVEMGLVRKGKSKSLGRMVYRLTSKMRESGYEDEDFHRPAVAVKSYRGLEWDFEDELAAEGDEEIDQTLYD